MYRPHRVCSIRNTSSAERAFVAMLCKRVNKKVLHFRCAHCTRERWPFLTSSVLRILVGCWVAKETKRGEKMGKLNQERSFTQLFGAAEWRPELSRALFIQLRVITCGLIVKWLSVPHSHQHHHRRCCDVVELSVVFFFSGIADYYSRYERLLVWLYTE